jgi:glycosyltransferase involved in cell wall biosynthesis
MVGSTNGSFRSLGTKGGYPDTSQPLVLGFSITLRSVSSGSHVKSPHTKIDPLLDRLLRLLTWRTGSRDLEAAKAPWLVRPGEVWVHDPTNTDSPEVGRLRSVAEFAGRRESATGVVAAIDADLIGVVDGTGRLRAAVALNDDGLQMWRRAVLSSNPGHDRPLNNMVPYLQSHDSLAIIATSSDPTWSDPTWSDPTWSDPTSSDPTSSDPTRHHHDSPSALSSELLSNPACRNLIVERTAIAYWQRDPSSFDLPTHLGTSVIGVLTTPIHFDSDVSRHGDSGITGPPPDPLSDPQGCRRWLLTPVTAAPHPISRLLASIRRSRPDLVETFGDLHDPMVRRSYLEWVQAFAHHPVDGPGAPTWAVPATELTAPLPPRIGVGTSPPLVKATRVVGFLDGALGLGAAGRQLTRAALLAGESVETINYRNRNGGSVPWRDLTRSAPAEPDIHIVCLNGDQLATWAGRFPQQTTTRAYRIGLWFWETDQLPLTMARGFELLDEVWVTSAFTQQAVKAAAPPHMPVHVVPLGVNPNDGVVGLHLGQASEGSAGSVISRQQVANDCAPLASVVDRPWFGFAFDISSTLVRKNPVGLINAWITAFPMPGDPVLVLKSINGFLQPHLPGLLADAAQGRADIINVDAVWPALLQHRFLHALSAYVSLHRSEGYGLPLLECMVRGIPVMATGATGNMAFMTQENSWMVPATPTLLSAGDSVYDDGGGVFEPDSGAAIALLRTLVDPQNASKLTAKARQAQLDTAGLADGTAMAHWMAHRLAAIRLERNGRSG